MLIYTQPGSCPACDEPLMESTTQIPGQNQFSVYVCQNCAVSIQNKVHNHSEDDSWMVEEYPDKYSMWELCAESFNKVKRRAALWDDLKSVLKNGKWIDQDTIDAVLTNMDYMEEESAHPRSKRTLMRSRLIHNTL